MYPKLFEIGPVPVYSYGLMLGIAFLIGSTIFSKELRRKNLDENIGVIITFLGIIGGIVGGKIFYILEEWNFGKGPAFSTFLGKDLFSPAGLTFYGGMVLSIAMIIIYCKKKKLSVLMIFDLMAPAATIAYGIARIGCHLSGDGCYGTKVNGTFWEFIGMQYSKGIVPTEPGVLVHPTSLYELGVAIIIFTILWKLRTKIKFNGQLFYWYLILTGIARFAIELIRVNPKVILFISQAQIISIIMILCGAILMIIQSKKLNNRLENNNKNS